MGQRRPIHRREGEVRRKVRLAVAVVSLTLPLIAIAAPSASALDRGKLSPAMSWFVDRGGYGDYPIATLVADHQPGDVYYLARVDGGIDAALEQDLNAAGAQVRLQFPEIDMVALVSPLDSVAAVSQLDRVDRLELDEPLEVQAIRMQYLNALPTVPFPQNPARGQQDVGAYKLWAQGYFGQGVRVGVVDSGIDSTHVDLDGQLKGFVNCLAIVPGIFVGDPDTGNCVPQQGFDDNGHGTHVSGIATGTGEGLLATHARQVPGMAPQAELVGAKACNGAGSCLTSSMMGGVRYLALEPAQGGLGADIINLSLGSGRFYGSPAFGAEQVTNDDASAQLMNALAPLNNVLFTVSAGNSGPTLQSVGSPSVASQVLSVGASITDWDLNHDVAQTFHGEFGNIRPEAAQAGATGIAQFSSRGPSGDRLIKPDLTAPGVYVVAPQSSMGAEVAAGDTAHLNAWSTDPVYAVLSGTSMAAPSAAGAAALVWNGYEATVGSDPAYYRLKAALVNTAGTRAFEGSVAGLLSGIRARWLAEDLATTFPLRNDRYVGITGEGAGRMNAAAALVALTKGVTIYTPQSSDVVHSLQPSWSLDDVGPGESTSQSFVLDGSPKLAMPGATTFRVENEAEPTGVNQAPAAWFRFPSTVSTKAGKATPFKLTVNVPANARPGMYDATIIATSKVTSTVTQQTRIPVQFFVPMTFGALEGPVWASDVTDYSLVGFEHPLGDIYSDWATFPLRIPAGTTGPITLSVYDVAGLDHMDVFVFTDDGIEIDSTVSSDLADSVPAGAAYEPTTAEAPHEVSILDDADYETIAAPTTVWVAVSDSEPDVVGFSTFHLDVSSG
jgi:subtilisin family serine protease